jgi:predicted alpha/beta-hydrolase family hydrolase
MLPKLPTFNFYHTPNTQELIIVTHGSSEGINSPFMEKIVGKTKTNKTSVLSIQMPFKDRGEKQSSGKELREELEALQTALDFVNYQNFEKLEFIGKSLGGIIFSRYLAGQPIELQSKSKLTILGFIVGDAVIPASIAEFNLIQGEYDKYGSPEQVQELIDQSSVENKDLQIIKGADHSYRNKLKEPVFQDEVIGLI